MRKTICIIFVFLSLFCFSQNTMNLLFVGDVMGHDAQLESAYNTATNEYEFDSCFMYISPIFKAHDFTIANLEVTLNCKPYSGYPAFSSPPALAIALVKSGVNCFVTANNHSADRGEKGVVQTIKVLDSIGVKHTGTFTSNEKYKSTNPLILEKNGIKIALLNYTFGLNSIPVPDETIINIIDTSLIKNDIQKSHKLKVDKVIVFIHWGTEYELSPNLQQLELAKFISDAGADIIIGSHPHVVQRAEFHKTEQQFVVYSLGNFISNQRPQPRDGGAMIDLKLQKINDKVVITDVGYILTWVYLPTINGKAHYFVLPVSKYESQPTFFDTPESYEKMQSCIKQNRETLGEQNIETQEIIYNIESKTWGKK